jgi:hypothetical protein
VSRSPRTTRRAGGSSTDTASGALQAGAPRRAGARTVAAADKAAWPTGGQAESPPSRLSYPTRTTKKAIATYWQETATIVRAWNSSW